MGIKRKTMEVLHAIAFGRGSREAQVLKVACGKLPPIGLDGKATPRPKPEMVTLMKASIEERIKASQCSCGCKSHSADRATDWIGCELKWEKKAKNAAKKRANKWNKPDRKSLDEIPYMYI
jgi:hypothetical protein